MPDLLACCGRAYVSCLMRPCRPVNRLKIRPPATPFDLLEVLRKVVNFEQTVALWLFILRLWPFASGSFFSTACVIKSPRLSSALRLCTWRNGESNIGCNHPEEM